MNGEPRIRPGRLRRRLTIAFLLVGGLSAAVLAASSYLLVRESRLGDSVDRSLEQTRFNLELAARITQGPPGEAGTDDILAAFERRGDFDTVGKAIGKSFSSSLSLGLTQVPQDLQRLVARGDLGYERVRVGGHRYLVAGGRVSGTKLDLYFFFDEDRLWSDLGQLGTILLAGVGILVLLAGLVGALLARSTLAPVARASDAARSLAEGLLATRLPTGRADEFGAWAQSFNQMADALQAKIAELSEARAREQRFTSDVAHELRTPLTALVGEASLLAEHLDRMPAEARRPAELLVADVARMRRLVEELMEISRFDAGREAVQEEPVDVAALVESAAHARGWGERVRLMGERPALSTDRRRLERIVANLVENSLAHGGGEVSVRLGTDAVGAFIEVADGGPGIAPEHLPRLFDRFYKADPARSSPGSGLGLAIARENARLLGGDIDVWSEVGRGTRFTVRLPVTNSLHAGDGAVSSLAHDGVRSGQGGMS